jgi:hypothetical protein
MHCIGNQQRLDKFFSNVCKSAVMTFDGNQNAQVISAEGYCFLGCDAVWLTDVLPPSSRLKRKPSK